MMMLIITIAKYIKKKGKNPADTLAINVGSVIITARTDKIIAIILAQFLSFQRNIPIITNITEITTKKVLRTR